MRLQAKNQNLGDGCILLSRSLLKSKVFQNEKILKVWIWCLLKANHRETYVSVKTGRGSTIVKVLRGQFIFGRNQTAKELNMKPSSIRNHVNFLSECQNLDIQANKHYSLITVRNYNTYQDLGNYKRTTNLTTKGQPKDTNNNDNNKRYIYDHSFQLFWSVYPRKVAKKKALEVWNKLRPDNGLAKKIVTAVEKAKSSIEWNENKGQYIPHPTTYLNQHRWEDELRYKKDWRENEN